MEDSKWSTNEALLQSYRSCFLSSQSMLVAVGAIVLDKSMIITIIISIIAILHIVCIWFPMIKHRGMVIDFHKYSMGELFDDKGNIIFTSKPNKYLQESTYTQNRVVRAKVNRLLRFEVDSNNEKIIILIVWKCGFQIGEERECGLTLLYLLL